MNTSDWTQDRVIVKTYIMTICHYFSGLIASVDCCLMALIKVT